MSATTVRAVEIKIQGRDLAVQHAAHAETPAGSIRDGRVVDPVILAAVLRRLWEQGSFTARRCTVAVPAGALAPQMLTVPPAPAAEQRRMLRGELARFAPEKADTPFGWLPMASGGGPGGNTLAFLADPALLAGYEEALSLAGLEIDALEPDVTAALRAAAHCSELPAGGAAAIYVSDECSDIAFLDGGRVRYYRRFDRGLVPLNGSPDTGPGAGEREDPELVAFLARQSNAPPDGFKCHGAVDEEQLAALALEIKRSFQYYGRAYGSAGQPRQLLLLGECQGPHLVQWASLLQAELHLEAECHCLTDGHPFWRDSGRTSGAQHRRDKANGWRGGTDGTVLGLALRSLADPASGSMLALTARDEALVLAQHAPRYLMAALTGSSLVAIAAMSASLWLGGQLNQVRGQLRVEDAELEAANAQHAASLIQVAAAKRAVDQLRHEALPVPQLLVRLGEIVPDTLDLTELQLQEDGSLALEGDAVTAAQVNRLLERLSDDPRFRCPDVDTLEARTPGGAAHFKVESGLTGYGKRPEKVGV